MKWKRGSISCFDAFSSREPVSTPDQVWGRLSLESALFPRHFEFFRRVRFQNQGAEARGMNSRDRQGGARGKSGAAVGPPTGSPAPCMTRQEGRPFTSVGT